MQRTRYLEKLNFIFYPFIGLLLPDRAPADVANSDSSSLPFPLRNGRSMKPMTFFICLLLYASVASAQFDGVPQFGNI